MISTRRVLALLPLVFAGGCSLVDKITGSSSSTCNGGTAYTALTSVTGATGEHNCKGPDGTDGQKYTLTLTQQTNMLLSVNNATFTPFLGIYTSKGGAIAQSTPDARFKLFLPAGDYQVYVERMAGKDGSFTLASTATSLGGCSSTTGSVASADEGVMTRGASFSGTLTSSDCGAVNAKVHLYEVRLATGDTLKTSVTVDQMAGVYLVNTTGAPITSKELPGPGTWTNTYVATADGFHIVRVESRAANGSSNLPLKYTISIN